MSDNLRESMDFDIVIVGAGPAGLARADEFRRASSTLPEALKRTTCVCVYDNVYPRLGACHVLIAKARSSIDAFAKPIN